MKALIIDLAHMVSTLVDTTQTLIAEVTHLKSNIKTIYEKKDAVVASINTSILMVATLCHRSHLVVHILDKLVQLYLRV